MISVELVSEMFAEVNRRSWSKCSTASSLLAFLMISEESPGSGFICASLVYAFLQGSNLKSLSLASSENLIPLQFLLQAISRQRQSR